MKGLGMKNVVIGILIGLCVIFAALTRYKVGESLPVGVYTESFDASDGIYKFCRTNFGEPNSPRLQAAPDDWISAFGNNERTLIFHNLSELRFIVAQQGLRLLELEKRCKDPNIPDGTSE